MAFKLHHQVTIYTNGSVMCDLTKAFFRDAGIDFDEINMNINMDQAPIDRLKEIGDGQTEYPVVDFDGRLITGYQPDIYSILLKEIDDRDKEKEAEEKRDANDSFD